MSVSLAMAVANQNPFWTKSMCKAGKITKS